MSTDNPNREKVLTAIKKGTTTVNELTDKLGISESTVRAAIDSLVEVGAIKKNGAKGRSASYVVFAEQEETKLKEEEKQNAGRPRQEEIKARDEQVLEIIKKAGSDGVTKQGIAEALGVTSSLAYISVHRLKKDGKITKVGSGTRSPHWVAA